MQRFSRLALLISVACVINAKPVHLRCNYRTNPLGIDTPKPNFSWQSDATGRNWTQSAYEIQVASSAQKLASGKADVWTSGKIASAESVSIAYGGPPLGSRRRYYWTVRVWDNHGRAASASESSWWEMGLLTSSDWSAKWIRWQNPEAAEDRAAMKWIWPAGQDALKVTSGSHGYFHVDVDLAQKPERAALFLIARGDWQVTVNGRDAGEKPHWKEFDRRDIGGLLVPGKNSIDVTVTAAAGPQWPPPPPGPVPAAFAGLLKITWADGRIERIPSSERWQARSDPNAAWAPAGIAGELSDARFGGDPGGLPQPAALLRREFAVEKSVAKARLYATALGAYETTINGVRVGRDELTPGFTDYSKRVQYQTYDVTDMLRNGTNAIGAMLGEGWFASGMAWTAEHFNVLPPTRMMAQLEIEYADGTRATVVSDGSWKAAESPILHSEIYAGETYDARLEKPGWDKAGFDDRAWTAAVVADPYSGEISSEPDAPPQIVKEMRPEKVNAFANRTYVFDMGQNIVGWVRLNVRGERGTSVRLRFAEILNPDGTIYTKNLRNADATDTYTLRGGNGETFAPRFTFHGFRYIEITGFPGTPTLDTIRGEVVSSISGEPAARVTTSSDLVNRMWNLGIWGQRGNFLSVPTDCPQRDERLGWMADAAVFWRTGSYNFDIAAFSRKWLRDVRDAQRADGAFSNVSPNIGVGTIEGAPGWGDAGVIVPWTTWLQYGDKNAVEANWPAMEHWMEFIQRANSDFIRKNKVGPDFADWLAPDPRTPKPLVDTAYWALIAGMMGDMARATGRADAAKKYAAIYDSIRAAFQKEYVHENGEIATGTQTSYVVALQMKLVPPALESAAVDHLVKDIETHNWHLTTGFLGTPFLLFALADHGKVDVAYRLLLNETYPSWGYMLSKGATTWWERWNGDTGDPAMNSYNHYAFGSVVAWVYQCIAGIDTALTGPGFHEIVIQPRLDARITQAHGEYDSVYGPITTDWHGTASGPFELKVTIPPNTTATVVLPEIANKSVTQDGKRISDRKLKIGSGSYEFRED